MYQCPKCKTYILTTYCSKCKEDIAKLHDTTEATDLFNDIFGNIFKSGKDNK